ncbi:hypothetical protein GGR51DRAFT_62225 [Nemania sp. FL0031]|nr:hypothetical protein GGR51DRAFT_62225 [Nemania sp. FL0031]
MHFLPVFLVTLLTGLSAAIPAQAPAVGLPTPPAPAASRKITKWTLSGVTRTKIDAGGGVQKCSWLMILQETNVSSTSTSTPFPDLPTPLPPTSGEGAGDSLMSSGDVDSLMTTDPIMCGFQVVAPKGQDCGTVNFGPTQCATWHPNIYVNGGHNRQNGFMVLVIVNMDENKQAYFGLSDGALDSGASIPPQTSTTEAIGSG